MNLVNLIFAFLPSILWLLFYLREDIKPEPKKLILTAFALGFISTLPALFFEFLFFYLLSLFSLPETAFKVLKNFFVVALVEEFFKFFCLAFFILYHREFDEKTDGMVYMITAGLGFAAAENLLIALHIVSFPEFLEISILRFFGATLIHALCCGIFGYFLSKYYFETKKFLDLFSGLFFATILHGIYNFSIISIKAAWQAIFPVFVLTFSFALVFLLFKRLKQK